MQFESFLRDRGIDYEKHTHATAYTAQRLADAEHVSGYMVAKPVVVKGSSGYTMCVLPAPMRLDTKRVAELLHEPEIELASESEMAELLPAVTEPCGLKAGRKPLRVSTVVSGRTTSS